MHFDYPVLDILESLREALRQHRVVILEAPPGAGKSTVLPLKLLHEPWLENQKIIMLEPRRLAARSVAERLSFLLEEDVGNTVGYRIRFESRVSDRTRLEVVTEGILTRMIQSDNTLEGIGLLIFDEFHERSLHADLGLALALQLQEVVRDDLRILVMSATLDEATLSTALRGAPVIKSSGRQYPVQHIYLGSVDEPIVNRMSKAIRLALREQQGDLLAFLPGASEINRTRQALEESNVPAVIHELYGELPFRQQQSSLLPDSSGARRVVLATSIAETSLTIEGIRVVVDSGLSRVPRYDPKTEFTRLETIKSTRDTVDQRAGRAGRLMPGVAYRLWAEAAHQYLVPHRTPEISEADLSPMLLELYEWGVSDPRTLRWITMPATGAIAQAKELLTQLGAIDERGITKRGRKMAKLPTHPRMAHVLLESNDEGSAVLALACDVVALLEERDPLSREAGPDLSLRVEVLRKWRSGVRTSADVNVLQRIEKVSASWRTYFRIEANDTIVADEDVGRLVALAYPDRLARQVERNGDRYKLAGGRVVRVPNQDHLTRYAWLAVAQLDPGQNEGKVYLAAAIGEADLLHLAIEQERVGWDDERNMVTVTREQRVGSLLLKSRPQESTPQQRTEVLMKMIHERGLEFIGWGEEERLWQTRLTKLRQWRPDEDWPDASDESLIRTMGEWLAPYLGSISKKVELEKLDKLSLAQQNLTWEKNEKLNVLAPSKIQVPSGSWIRVHYPADDRPPFMEVRLQELFGLEETPRVNGGRTAVVLHLLSPGFKPVQVTQDLRSFWEGTYHEVKKELKRRYPKHSWPDDPWTAEAVRGARRRPSSDGP